MHFSVEVSGADGTLQTHQVITDLNGSSTSIVSAADVPPGDVVNSVELDVPDAGAAMQTQTELMNTGDLGPYDKVLNSCVSHVCDVLNAAGVETPAAQGSAQLKFLLNLLKGG